jgi:membrane protein required for colicin V production
MSLNMSDIIVDLIIVLILMVFIFRGFKNGFIKEFIGFLGTYVSFVLAIRYMSNLASLLYGATDVLSHTVVTILSFIIIFLPLMTIFMFVAKKLKLAARFSFTLGSVDRIVGLGIGLIKGAIILAITALIISLSGIAGLMSEQINASQLYKPVLLKRVLPLTYSVAKLLIMSHYKPFKSEIKEALNANTMSTLDRRGRDVVEMLEEN